MQTQIKKLLLALFLCIPAPSQAQDFMSLQEGSTLETVHLPKSWAKNVKSDTVTSKQKRLILRIALRKYFVKELSSYGNSQEKKFLSWLKRLINRKLEEFVFQHKTSFPSFHVAKVSLKVYVYKFVSIFKSSPYFALFNAKAKQSSRPKNIIHLFSQSGQPAAVVILPQKSGQAASCPGIKAEEAPQLPRKYANRIKFDVSPGAPVIQTAFDFLLPVAKKMGRLKISPQLCLLASEYLMERQNFEENQNITLPWSYHGILENKSLKNGVIIFAQVKYARLGSLLPRVHILRIREQRLAHTWWHREINDPSHVFSLRDAQDHIAKKLGRPHYVSTGRISDLSGLQLAFHHHIKQPSFLKVLALLKYHFKAKSKSFQVYPKAMIKHHSLYSSSLTQSDLNSLEKLMATHLPNVYIRKPSPKGGLVYFEPREAEEKEASP